MNAMEKTKWWALALVVLCTFLTSAAQLMLKRGVMLLSAASWYNSLLLFGLIFYGVAALLLVVALRFGELSVLYPAVATSFIWVNIFSSLYLGELVSPLRWAGMAFIIFGISCIGWGSKTLTTWRQEHLL